MNDIKRLVTKEQQALVLSVEAEIRRAAGIVYRRFRGKVEWEELYRTGWTEVTYLATGYKQERAKFGSYIWRGLMGALTDFACKDLGIPRAVRRGGYKAAETLQKSKQFPATENEQRAAAAEGLRVVIAGTILGLYGEARRASAPDPEASAIRGQLEALVGEAMTILSPADRRFVELCYYDEMPIEDAGKHLEMGRTVAYARHRGILERLGARLHALGVKGTA